MKAFILAGSLVLAMACVAAADTVLPQEGATVTAQVAGLTVTADTLQVTPKEGYVHVMWDAFPSRAAIAKADKAFSLKAAALSLAKNQAMEKDPKAVKVKVDIVEFPERDDYGAPRWDKVQFLGRFEAEKKAGKWAVKEKAAK